MCFGKTMDPCATQGEMFPLCFSCVATMLMHLETFSNGPFNSMSLFSLVLPLHGRLPFKVLLITCDNPVAEAVTNVVK